MRMRSQWQNPRGIQERIIVQGSLVLDTPTHFGNGDAEGPLDMPIFLDPLEGKALLTGTSIAGALRNYLREFSEDLAKQLFGDVGPKESIQSPLIVDDALGREPEVELRDGVAIDPRTRTAEAKRKFDIELLTSGTEFLLSFELLVLKNKGDELLQAFAIALQGLEKGEISLGKRKSRGFGKCHVSKWILKRYNVTVPCGLIAWLKNDHAGQMEGNSIASLLSMVVPIQEMTKGHECTLEGTFSIDGSLLIRSDFGESDGPDFTHLHSKREDKYVPVLSGTSLAGALRARALRISKTLGKDGHKIADDMFGNRIYEGDQKKELAASRIWIDEAIIQDPLDLVHTRVKIDRFTGGSYPAALFSERPIFGKLARETTVRISLKIQKANKDDIGLLLLLLKDLWTGDLIIGGESSIGRGRLKGKQAIMNFDGESWIFSQADGKELQIEGNKVKLAGFVQAFVEVD